MAVVPEIGDVVFMVIVECSCPDRWWAQPEGSYFPICPGCGEEAKPRGDTYEDRREKSIGAVAEVMPEMEACRDPRRRERGIVDAASRS